MDTPFLDFKIIDFSDIQSIISNCEGNTESNIFICFSEADTKLEDLLAKILSAVKLDLKKDVLLLRKTPENGFSFSALKRHYSIRKALIFGLSAKSFGIQVNSQKYQPFSIGGCTFIFADALSLISEKKELKMLLWKGLQGMFL